MKLNKTRRAFLKSGIKFGIGIPFAGSFFYSCLSKAETKDRLKPPKQLNILILGGTSFLGPHQIAYAIKRGHSISTFTRGKTIPSVHKEMFKQVEQLVGDRKDNLSALENRKWDLVIDNSGRKAEWTDRSAALLKENCDLYLYTSSTGVYYPYINSDFKEESAVFDTMPEQYDKDLELEFEYGVMKVNSEKAAIKHFGKERTIIVRPTYMIGPADKTDRFIHWPIRLKQGGEIMIPGKRDDSVQYMDVRDVAEWMIRLAEEKNTGTFNAVGPQKPQSMHEFVSNAKMIFDVPSKFVWIDDYDFLKNNNVHYIVPWIMPTEYNAGSAKINNSKALENGLSFRSLEESIKDTYDWWYSDAVTKEHRNQYLSNPDSILSREPNIIKKWKAL